MAPNLSKIKGIARRSPHYTVSPTVNGTVYVDLKTSSKSRFSTYNAENGLLVKTIHYYPNGTIYTNSKGSILLKNTKNNELKILTFKNFSDFIKFFRETLTNFKK